MPGFQLESLFEGILRFSVFEVPRIDSTHRRQVSTTVPHTQPVV